VVGLLPFQPEADLVDARARSRRAVDHVLTKLAAGSLPDDVELERVDIKEEAGRRGSGGTLLAGEEQNTAAATQLADEVAAFANTPGGGALVVGVENRSGDLLGTNLDRDWLRHAIYTRVDLAPLVEVREINGVRLLVVHVAPAAEPVEDTQGRIRWRVGKNSVPVDRAEWWLHRQDQAGYDSMAVATARTMIDVSAGAMAAAHRYLRASGQDDVADATVADVLRRLGVLHPNGHLTQAGALLFCPADRTYLSLSVLDVEGGDVVLRPQNMSGLSVLEQLAAVEARLETLNTEVTVRGGFAQSGVRRLPPASVREAVLNGLAHRDWLPPDPVAITWVQADSALQVVSPGGFVGGVTAETVLTQRHARHPALTDLFRALGLVDRQGLGVDRMYREMVALGHRPPIIVEQEGPRVRVRLVGGQPVVPVMALAARIEPAVRRRDVRVALIVDDLLHQPFTTADRMARVLQRTAQEAAEALETAAECRVDGSPLIVRFKDVWVLAASALRVVEGAPTSDTGLDRGVLAYRRPENPASVVRSWLISHDRMTSGDYATLTGLTQAGALYHLDRLVADGLLVRGDGKGRNAHFRCGPGLGRGSAQSE
jgi:ATP-dependent DNA helicase RecG